MTLKILRKRLIGCLALLITYSVFIASTPDDIVHVPENRIDASILKDAIFNNINVDTTNDETILKKVEVKNTKSKLKQRYEGLGYKNEHPYIRQVINEFMPTVKKYSNEYGICSSVVMALFINEFVIPSEHRLTNLAYKYHNYGSLKEKKDGFLSDWYKQILEDCTNGIVKYKDDEFNSDGKLIPSHFYSFKSRDAGIKACVAFIADRVKSDHPNYKDKFNNLNINDIYGWANELYNAGYAKKSGYPLDKKLIRIIRTYNLSDYE